MVPGNLTYIRLIPDFMLNLLKSISSRLKLDFSVYFLLLIISSEKMDAAVAFDNSTSHSSASASSLTWSHTSTGTATNGVIMVYVVGSSTMTSATTVTYNGISLYNLGGNTAGTTEGRFFWLANPPTGAHDVVVTVGGGSSINVAEQRR
jgi:hypothetical protein